MRARTYSPKVLRLVDKAHEVEDEAQSEMQPSDNEAAPASTDYKELSPNNILHLQSTIGNQAVRRLLAQRSTSTPTSSTTSSIQRKLDLTAKWTSIEKNKYETAFNKLEEIVAILKGKAEAEYKKFKDLVAILTKYDNKPTAKSPGVLEDFNKVVAGLDYAKGLAAKYVEEAEPAKEPVESDESEGEGEDYDLAALAAGSTTGKKIKAEQEEQAKAEKLKEEADKGAKERDAYYAGFTQKTAKAELTKWVTSEADRMVNEIKTKFAAAPQTYGSVYYTQPDARLLGIAKLTAAGLYNRIATQIKAEFPEGEASHIKGYFYHRTKSATKGAGGFNITGWTEKHETIDKSPFNLHVVHQ